MEKKELWQPDKFVIWKIDVGRLIQKYEQITHTDGRTAHKSLSTVKNAAMVIHVDMLTNSYCW